MNELNPVPEKKPWWNDGDAVGGLAATFVVLGLSFVVFCSLIWLGFKIWP